MKNILITICILAFSFSLGAASFATEFIPSPIPKPSTIPGPVTAGTATASSENNFFTAEILPRIALGLIGFVGAATLIMLIVSGIRFATLYGNDEDVDKAKSEIIYSIIGFIVAILAFTIVSIIVNFEFKNSNNQNLDTTNRNQEASQNTPTSNTPTSNPQYVSPPPPVN